jgi:hypothetical protein
MKQHVSTIALVTLLASCASVGPKMKVFEKAGEFVLEPASYSDEHIDVRYVLGGRIYHLSVENKTDSEILIDADRFFIISYGGQVLNVLDAHQREDNTLVIPPRSSYVLPDSYTPVIFDDYRRGTDKEFRLAPPDKVGTLEQYINKGIRLYFSVKTRGETRAYDIHLTIRGVKQLDFVVGWPKK